MDFRTCPACKASVLEDDVDDCPFCGASMSGKPGAAPKPKPAAAPARPAKAPASAAADKSEKPAARPAGGPPKPGPRRPFGETTADEENPFDIDTAAVRKAIAVSPKPTKSRTYEVKCKMCETVGYIAPADAGKDVKCCNPECMVPIFKAPPLAKQSTDDDSGKKGFTLAKALMFGIPVLLAAGGAFIFLKKPEEKPVEIPLAPVPVQQTNRDELVKVDRDVQVQVELTPEELRKRARKEIESLAVSGDRARPRSVRLLYAIDGHADTGNLEGARSLLARLTGEDKSQSFYQIQPLVSMALRQLATGDRTSAEKSADAALKHVDRLPKTDRASLDAACSLAALQLQLGRTQSGVELIKKFADAGPRGVASALWLAATEGQTYDLDLEAGRPSHLSMTAPLWVSVVELLTARGATEQALALCQSSEVPNSDVRDGAYSAWASMLAVKGGLSPADLQQKITTVISAHQLGPVTQSRIWSAVAYHYAAMKQESDSRQVLTKGIESLAGEVAPSPSAVPNMKALYNSRGRFFAGLPDPAPSRSRATAEASVAVVQARLGSLDEASTSFIKALKAAQAIAPSLIQTRQLVEGCEKNRTGLQSQLQSTLGLRNPNATELDRVFNAYRGQVDNLHIEARSRFALEIDLIRAVADQGLLEPVWNYLLERQNAANLADQQDYLKSDIPGYLAGRAIIAGNRELAQGILTVMDSQGQPTSTLDLLIVDAEQTAQSDLKGAADKIDSAYRKGDSKTYPQRLDIEVLRLMSRLSKSHDHVALMTQYLMGVRDAVLREDGFRLISATAMKAGQGRAVWDTLHQQEIAHRLSDTDEVALLRGFLERLPVTP